MAAGREALDQAEAPAPPEAIEQAAQRRRVRIVLAEMPAREAQLLVLRHAGYSYKEISAALGMAPSSVGTLLARAEAEFERRWQATEADPGG
mgnify:FL=1